jgi:hypothetical protein
MNRSEIAAAVVSLVAALAGWAYLLAMVTTHVAPPTLVA